YRGESGDAHAAVRAAIAAEDAWLERWLDLPPQTNETARSAAVMAGLLVAADRFGLPFELLELGSSAGLNLNLAHYRFDLGGVAAGDPASSLVLAPKWHGPPPPAADARILSARGIDMSPIAIADPENRERLIAYIWPEQAERVARLETAIAIAEAYPPRLECGDAADWIEARLAEPRTSGVARIVFHTITFQYFPDSTKARVEHAIRSAGDAANAETPLGWLRLEANADRDTCELRLTLWPDGTELHLADAHPHCAWISWRGRI
ncbi:DUF2332 domain-containing protein, partial [Sphingopyxis sp.]|uniref:DUF2332 domain-containing protein n=1 Tax=Sphingopyxis sp. TaxID=1908224 RepID=UPI002EDA2427